jgi:tRNA pseudouridine55 synthase
MVLTSSREFVLWPATIANQKSRMDDMDGVLIMDKPAGMTSHDVVARVRRITGQRRVGHTGTLDPFATGVLVMLVGRATRLAQFLSGADKEYEALIRLGHATDTGDITGVPIAPHAGPRALLSFSKEEIETAMASLRGEIDQTPPMYSAKKVGGRKLYELARRGQEIERKPVRVNVSVFETLTDDVITPHQDGSYDLKVRVVCSAGTYIRTLAEDFGRQLGVGAHVAGLRRTRAGRFTIAGAVTLDQLSQLAESSTIDATLISPDAAIFHLPAISLSDDQLARTLHGAGLQIENPDALRWADGEAVRMRDHDGQLVAMGTYDKTRRFLHPSVVIANND